MKAACLICREEVPLYAQSDHLRFKHRAPAGGFRFWFDAKAFFTEQPSMTIAGLLNMVDAPPTNHFYLEHKDGDIPMSHTQAVDLTNESHFYCVPSARM